MKITLPNTTAQSLVHSQDDLHLPKCNLQGHTPSTAQDTAKHAFYQGAYASE